MKPLATEIVWDDKKWHIRLTFKGRKPEEVEEYDTKALAMFAGNAVAKALHTELVIKNKDGSIGKGKGSKSSFGNDPKGRG